MSDDDLIRRGDALYAIAGWEIPSTAIAAIPAVTVDPALSDRAVRVAEALRNIGPMLDLRLSGATIIYDLLAQNAALRGEVRKSAMDAVSAGCQAQEAWEAQKAAEAQIAALTAQVELLTGAADRVANWTIGGKIADDPENREKYPLLTQAILDLRAAVDAARAALSATATTEEGHE